MDELSDMYGAEDPTKPESPLENDPLRQTKWPSEMPSISSIPTGLPSQFPSFYPTYEPTQHPTGLASSNPSTSPKPTTSQKPTLYTPKPTLVPTTMPTMLSSNIPSNIPTAERPDNYFNYNPASPYGPPHWDDVRDGDEFFDEYVSASSRECGDSLNSPINLEWKDQCEDDHHVHTQRGYNDWDTNKFEVLPHALRVVFSDRGGPPRADFSNLSEFVEAFYLDVKIPSEHLMEGKQFFGEVHIGHDWSSRGINIGFFLDPVSNVFNPRFEMLIREWEEAAWERRHHCQYRSEINYPRYVRTHPILNKKEAERVWIPHDDRSGDADWDLYQLQPTLWYYGYRGGYTVPPCTESVYWRFLDFPAHISWKQYNRMKALIVDQLDRDCNQASIAHNGGINRPVQRFRGDIWRCRGWKVKYKEDWPNYWPDWYHAMKTDKLD